LPFLLIHMDVDLEGALQAAVDAALEAGKIMRECYELRYKAQEVHLSATAADVDLSIDEKTAPTDLVTKYDKMCDQVITNRLKRHSEDSGLNFRFITEEICPDAPLSDEPTWIVDPIDGTMAFVHLGFDCCVSIGLAIGRKPVLGVVYCPFLGSVGCTGEGEGGVTASVPVTECFPSPGELYTAVSGRGAFLNGRRIFVNKAPRSRSVVIFNMPWRMAHPAITAAVAIRHELAFSQFHAIRSYGAAVLQLAQVAAGRAELYMEPGGKSWDVCAGAILVLEAGGCVVAIEGNPFTLDEHTITAAATEELAAFGAQICKKYDFKRAYFAE
jgi:fructose-1,6-bisphosphatase/inositol monophosphatase family enzyme